MRSRFTSSTSLLAAHRPTIQLLEEKTECAQFRIDFAHAGVAAPYHLDATTDDEILSPNSFLLSPAFSYNPTSIHPCCGTASIGSPASHTDN